MLHRILNLLRSILQAPARFPYTEPVHFQRTFLGKRETKGTPLEPRQGRTPGTCPPDRVPPLSHRSQDAHILQPLSTTEEELNETDPLLVRLVSARERTTEPYRAFVRPKHPMQRYRDLDVMLEDFKRDRLTNLETELVPEPVHKLARHLQRKMEQDGGK